MLLTPSKREYIRVWCVAGELAPSDCLSAVRWGLQSENMGVHRSKPQGTTGRRARRISPMHIRSKIWFIHAKMRLSSVPRHHVCHSCVIVRTSTCFNPRSQWRERQQHLDKKISLPPDIGLTTFCSTYKHHKNSLFERYLVVKVQNFLRTQPYFYVHFGFASTR